MAPKSGRRIRTLADIRNNSEEGNNAIEESSAAVAQQYNSDDRRSDTACPSRLPTPVVPHNFNTSSSSSSPSYSENDIPLAVIPNLPHVDRAQALLNRVVREFAPIMKARGYAVQSVSEFCCCADGLDFMNANGNNKRPRKRPIQNGNVLGYNQITTTTRRRGVVQKNNTFRPVQGGTSKTTSHTIHLRLRKSHTNLHSYETVAGTLAHELAHCEHANHSPAFYRLMNELLDEHALEQCRTSSRGMGQGQYIPTGNSMSGQPNNNGTGSGVQPFSGQGHKLGRGIPLRECGAYNNAESSSSAPSSSSFAVQGHRLGGGPGRRRTATAAAKRRRMPPPPRTGATTFQQQQQPQQCVVIDLTSASAATRSRKKNKETKIDDDDDVIVIPAPSAALVIVIE